MPYAPPELMMYVFLKAFPGYTVQTMLEEDAHIVEALLAVHNGEVEGRNAIMRRG